MSDRSQGAGLTFSAISRRESPPAMWWRIIRIASCSAPFFTIR